MNVYSLFDRKLRQYGSLTLERNDYGVQRAIADGMRAQPDALISKHPDDFDLYEVGRFHDESGLLEEPEGKIPRLVINCAELVYKSPSHVKEG